MPLKSKYVEWYYMTCYKEIIFSTCAHEFFNTNPFKKHKEEIDIINFMNVPKCLTYGYIDLFFEKLMKKYDSDHIILNRFRFNTYYLDKNGNIQYIPETFRRPYHSNDKYNRQLFEIEAYIIEKYNPYVIDLSKYYMVDENIWDNLNGEHFEEAFYRETFSQIKKIIYGETTEKYFSSPNFFDINRIGYEKR